MSKGQIISTNIDSTWRGRPTGQLGITFSGGISGSIALTAGQ